ncbi:Phytanoyl-CoA dioxygenase (PhyH) [Andreprevotia lacus DSM 23236]|jgi:hypothetical protein|uniref:Phytanoyl-CoA dioxygenase (PhyH) n=1 Tax=Andreprevotia lacus DSM 23236 TaxID=1121001 RepID=A0A1W1XEB6_9NEIS|nr:phytanoyl-CoA dioxygenase family protein [Andreprevotia lacus]SMC22192.1 Phytanoyl-CoA dioxygenase (PhyH) [Andreprevotia lacus DSM 23236]
MFSILSKKMEVAVTSTAKHLGIGHAGNPADFGGIVRIEVVVDQAVSEGGELSVYREGDESAAVVLGNVSAGEVVPVGVHFILLPNGVNRLVFMLREASGLVSVATHDLTVENVGSLAEETATLMRAAGSPLFFVGPCDSTVYPYGKHVAWFDRPDAKDHIRKLQERGEISAEEAAHLAHFVDKGFLMVEGLIDDKLVDSVNGEIDAAIAEGYQGYKLGSSQRIEHLHLSRPNMRKLWLDARHRRYADLIFGVQSRPCQTLTYVFGSQQDEHQDLIHLTPFPAGYMCGVWIALQDVVADSGELVVYPGSHREPRVYLQGTGCAKVKGNWQEFGEKVCSIWAAMTHRYEKFIYRPKKGTVLIWHENLLHAGSVRLDQSLERRSVVIHSFADGAAVYYDSTGLNGSAARRELLV